MPENVADRVERLRAELERERDHYLGLGRNNYSAVIVLMILTVGSSAAAGILGMIVQANSQLVGAIALIPALVATVANHLKLQGKCEWHYRKYDLLKALLRRVNYDLPLAPSAKDVAEIGQTLSKIEAEMTAAWVETLTFKFEDAANRDGRKKPA